VRCISLDCPWLFQRKKVEQQAEDIELLQELVVALEPRDNTKLECHDDSNEEPQDDDEINSRIRRSWDNMGEEL
jgi:hypothetical protein